MLQRNITITSLLWQHQDFLEVRMSTGEKERREEEGRRGEASKRKDIAKKKKEKKRVSIPIVGGRHKTPSRGEGKQTPRRRISSGARTR